MVRFCQRLGRAELSVAPYIAAVAGIVGTLIGGAITFVTQRALAKDTRRAEANAVRLGIAAEIEAYLGIVDRRNHIDTAKVVLVALRGGNNVSMREFGVDKDEDPAEAFVVFNGNVSKLGALGAEAGDVTKFYISAMAVRTTARSAARGEFDAYTAEQKFWLLSTELDLWQETVVLGRRLIDRLRLH
jgi:hypothetical protein